jgi:hypothetical protein
MDGVYVVMTLFQVPQPPSVAMDVLTDYESIPSFMPAVKTSIVRERRRGGALVEQEAVSRVLMFSKRVFLLLDVQVTPATIVFRDISRKSFSHYEGAWKTSSTDGVTTIEYTLKARPSFDVPEFVLMRALKRDAQKTVERLRLAIALRSVGSQPGGRVTDITN